MPLPRHIRPLPGEISNTEAKQLWELSAERQRRAELPLSSCKWHSSHQGRQGRELQAEPLPLLILSLGFFLPFLLSSCSPSPSLWPCWGITNTSHIKAVTLGQCHNSFSMQQQTLLCSGASGRAAGGESYTWISSRGTIPPTPKIPLFGAPAHGTPFLSNQALRKRTHLLR